jgi:hypothetical protein
VLTSDIEHGFWRITGRLNRAEFLRHIPNLPTSHVPNLPPYDSILTGVPNVPKIEQCHNYGSVKITGAKPAC